MIAGSFRLPQIEDRNPLLTNCNQPGLILPDVAPPPNANDPPAPPLRKMQKVQISSGEWIEVLQEPEVYRRNEAGEIEVAIPPHMPEPAAAPELPSVKIEPVDDMQNLDIADVPVTFFARYQKMQ